MILISIVSGIHRTLVGLLSNILEEQTAVTSIYQYTEANPAPLEVWLVLAMSVAPFGLAKAIADYTAGRLAVSSRKRIIILGIGFYFLGLLVVIIALLPTVLTGGQPTTNPFFQFLLRWALPLASGCVGSGEGFFYAAAQISLSDLATGRTRGKSLGFSEFSIYMGYTMGSVVAGLITQGDNFLMSYLVAMVMVVATVGLVTSLIRDTQPTEGLTVDAQEDKVKAGRASSQGEEIITTQKKPADKIQFQAQRLLRKTRILTVLLGSHFSKWGDAFVWLLPVYLGVIFTIGPQQPDTLTIGFLVGSYTAIWAVSMLLTSYITEVFGRKLPIIAGIALSGTGFLLLVAVPKTGPFVMEWHFVAVALAGLGTGLYYPLLPAIGLDIVIPDVQGQTLGMFRAIRDFGYFTGPIFLSVLVFFAGSTVNDLSVAALFTGCLMLVVAGFFTLLLRETRPNWPYFEEICEHTTEVQRVVEESVKGFNPENYSDPARMKELVNSAKAKEKRADQMKRQIRRSITISIRQFPDASEFLYLVRAIDKIAGKTATAVLKFSKLTPEFIPPSVLSALTDLALTLPPLMHQLVLSLELLDEKLPLSFKEAMAITTYEQITDEAYDRYLSHMFHYESFYPEVDRVTFMFTLKECGDLLEEAADQIESAADLVSIIAMKHKL